MSIFANVKILLDAYENLQAIDPRTEFIGTNSPSNSVQEFIEQTEMKTSKIKISGGAISIGSSLLAITGIVLIPFRKEIYIHCDKGLWFYKQKL